MLDLKDITLIELVKMLAPLIIMELSLKVFCLYLIIKNGVRNLSKLVWAIILLANIVGPVAFLLFGRRRDSID